MLDYGREHACRDHEDAESSGLHEVFAPMIARAFRHILAYPPVAKPGYRVMPPSTKMLVPLIESA